MKISSMTDIDTMEAIATVCGLKSKRVCDVNGRPFYLLIGKNRVSGTFNSTEYACDALVRFAADGSFMEASIEDELIAERPFGVPARAEISES